MDQSVIDAWIRELRSGKWPQTFGRLAKHESRCAVGVLCESQGYSLVKAKGQFVTSAGYTGTSSLGQGASRLLGTDPTVTIWVTREDAERVGLIAHLDKKNVPSYGLNAAGDYSLTVTYLNDALRLPLERIADVLEVAYFPNGVEKWTGTRSSSAETGTARKTGNRPLFGQLNP